jgi:hypothetical protein
MLRHGRMLLFDIFFFLILEVLISPKEVLINKD